MARRTPFSEGVLRYLPVALHEKDNRTPLIGETRFWGEVSDMCPIPVLAFGSLSI